MTAQPHPSQFEIEPDAEARAARRIAVAHRLVEMGLEVAEAVQRRALAQLADEAAGEDANDGEGATCEAPRGRRVDPVAAVERVARTVRLSLALAARLDSDEPVRRARVRSNAAAERDAEAEARKRAREAEQAAERARERLREDKVLEVLETTLKASGLDGGEVCEHVVEIEDRMAEALSEREWEYDYLRRPVGAVIARLCEDYGLEPDWSLWAAEAWAVEEAATNAEGSPYAAGGAAYVERAASEPADAPPEEAVRADGSSP
jgi:hypothetical protein